MVAIKTIGLTKDFGDVVAVNGVNLEVYEGEIFALLGVNGAGKTTLIKMLSTILEPSSGNGIIYGKSITKEIDEIKEIIDISMQETAIAKNLTVQENIEFYAKLNGQSREEVDETVRQIYSIFQLDKFAKKQAKKLSGGWQRKLSIALALAKKPKVLFLDEPTLGLDVIARRELWKTILELKNKTTILLTTHYMEEAEALSDRIGVMKDGKLLFVGTKDCLFSRFGAKNVEDSFIKIIEMEDNRE